MTVAHAAVVFGVTPQTIRNWITAGAPHVAATKGAAGSARVSGRALMEWRAAEALAEAGAGDDQEYNEGRAKAADWHYKAILRQTEARKRLGSLVAIDDIADAVAEDYDRVRSRLNSVPSRLSVQIAAESDASIVRTMISRAINEALENLSTPSDVIERAGGNPSASIHDPLDLGDLPDDIEEEDLNDA